MLAMEKQIYAIMLIMCFSSLAKSQSQSQTIQVKVTRLRFFLQDVIGGEKPTVWGVTACNLTGVMPSEFGKLLMMDDLVTSGPDADSGEVGRLQGTAGLTDLREKAIVVLLNLVLTAGEFKGSTLNILGRNPINNKVRELSIVGGTSAFRMATGYILTTTYFNDSNRVWNVYEYNAVVYRHVDSDNISSPL